MKILALMSSARKNSATNALVKEAADAAKIEGAEITSINLNEMKIEFVSGDYPNQIEEPDFKKVNELIKDSDAFIIGVPVYWANMPAILKNVIDRATNSFLDLTGPMPKPLLVGKKALIFTSCASPKFIDMMTRNTIFAIKNVKSPLKVAGVNIIGTHSLYSVKDEMPKDMEKHLDKAKKMGKKLVR